jgi:hypothetical protein
LGHARAVTSPRFAEASYPFAHHLVQIVIVHHVQAPARELTERAACVSNTPVFKFWKKRKKILPKATFITM